MATSTLTGQQIADLSDAHPPIQPANVGVALNVLVYILLVISFIVVGARIFVCISARTDGHKWGVWGIHDFCAILGFVSYRSCESIYLNTARREAGTKSMRLRL